MSEDDKLLMEFIKAGFDSLGKSIDVLRGEIKDISDKTTDNGESIAVFGEKIRDIKEDISNHVKAHDKDKDRQLKKIALVSGGISTFIAAGATFLNWI